MQTIHIDIEESKLEILLNIIKNLKDDVIKSYSVSPKTNEMVEEDAFFYKRKERLKKLHQDVISGEMPMYDLDSSMDELIKELKS